jgi:hypothetical protein
MLLDEMGCIVTELSQLSVQNRSSIIVFFLEVTQCRAQKT